jgi:hypothetical protein
MLIYDRWGELIFERRISPLPTHPTVGTGRQWRKNLTPDISPYRIMAEMKNGEIYNKSVAFTLLR